MTEAYIYDAVRTPRGKGRKDGSLHEVTSARLSAGIMNALKDRNDLQGHAVEDVIWGNVTQVGEQGGCLARTAVLASELDQSIPGLSINRFCASGMEAVDLAANQIKGGAGGAGEGLQPPTLVIEVADGEGGAGLGAGAGARGEDRGVAPQAARGAAAAQGRRAREKGGARALA